MTERDAIAALARLLEQVYMGGVGNYILGSSD